MNLLSIKGVFKNFGGLAALQNVNLNVRQGEIKALIGPNGAGKTTLLNIISGIHRLDKGEILFKDEKINNLPPSKIANKGISRTFQHVELFGNMTVLENIMVGFYARNKTSFFMDGFKFSFITDSEKKIYKKSREFLEYVKLGHKINEIALNLPIGEQRILEIARALATEPGLILLDEPAAGLNIRETRELGEIIKRIREELGITILLVEHDMELVMNISDSVAVLNFGEIIADGTPMEVQKNRDVIVAYLGEEEEVQPGYNVNT
ncbi:MAG: ABC transporter ATP-binding protein [Nitrospirae bacterium]|nr:ABC transporter ATP-binding protein [Nitrospirota bacterium]